MSLENVTPAFQAKENLYVRRGLTPLPEPHITGMKLLADVVIGDLTLNTRDANGVVWVCTDIGGWWTLPEPDYPEIERSFGDGSYDMSGRYLARSFELKGSILVPDPDMVLSARDTLSKALNLVYSGAWLKAVERQPSSVGGADGITKAAFVRLAGQPDIEVVSPRGRINFSVDLFAADPIKYQWSSASDGLTTSTISPKNATLTGEYSVSNSGNISVGAVISITGPVTGPLVIKNTTANTALTVSGILTGGRTLTVTARSYTDGYATLSTQGPHELYVGKTVAVSAVDTDFNGTYEISDLPSANSFSYKKTYPDKKATLTSYKLGESVSITNVTVASNVATITTSSAHSLSGSMEILMSGFPTAAAALNGQYEILSTPSTTTFTVTSPSTLASLGATATSATGVVSLVTLTSATAIPFLVGDVVGVFNVSSTVNINRAEILTKSTDGKSITYYINRSRPVLYKSHEPNTTATTDTITLTTASIHGYQVGDTVYVQGCGRPVNIDSGEISTAVTKKSDYTLSFSIPTLTRALSSIAITNPAGKRYRLTVTTSSAHSFNTGDSIKLTAVVGRGTNPPGINGTFSITRQSSTVFYYDVTVANNTKNALISRFGADKGTIPIKPASSKAAYTTPDNSPVLSSSSESSSVGGSVTTFATVSATNTTGSVEFVYMPERVSTGTVTVTSDQLVIDTSQRSVLLNGQGEYARAKLTTTSDWIRLLPGSNNLTVVDNGNAVSTAVVTIKYRSGWLS